MNVFRIQDLTVHEPRDNLKGGQSSSTSSQESFCFDQQQIHNRNINTDIMSSVPNFDDLPKVKDMPQGTTTQVHVR